jgi:ligand-binding SRPBCC domain-containing protein
MPVAADRFRVNAPLEAVAHFHRDPRALRLLSPPPVVVQIHKVESLAEGSQSEFTLWFGPIPLRWLAIHSQVDFGSGFTDRQARGPLASWSHRHSWQALPDGATEMQERIEYSHQSGPYGLLTRILFAGPMMRILFRHRRAVIRRACEDEERGLS